MCSALVGGSVCWLVVRCFGWFVCSDRGRLSQKQEFRSMLTKRAGIHLFELGWAKRPKSINPAACPPSEMGFRGTAFQKHDSRSMLPKQAGIHIFELSRRKSSKNTNPAACSQRQLGFTCLSSVRADRLKNTNPAAVVNCLACIFRCSRPSFDVRSLVFSRFGSVFVA